MLNSFLARAFFFNNRSQFRKTRRLGGNEPVQCERFRRESGLQRHSGEAPQNLFQVFADKEWPDILWAQPSNESMDNGLEQYCLIFEAMIESSFGYPGLCSN